MSGVIIVAGSFHEDETEKMIQYAKDECSKLNLTVKDVIKVPGAFEIPFAIKHYFTQKNAQIGIPVITLGIIEKGQTDHGKAIGDAVLSALMKIQFTYNVPIGLGIIGPGAEPEHIAPRLEKHARASANAVRAMLDL